VVISWQSARTDIEQGQNPKKSFTLQSHAESGCRFLNDPLGFVSALLVKKLQADARVADGDDVSVTGVCGDAASVTSAMSGARFKT
jgi:hypothetical protein